MTGSRKDGKKEEGKKGGCGLHGRKVYSFISFNLFLHVNTCCFVYVVLFIVYIYLLIIINILIYIFLLSVMVKYLCMYINLFRYIFLHYIYLFYFIHSLSNRRGMCVAARPGV